MSTAVFGAPGFKARNGMTVREGDDGSLKVGNVDGYLSQAAAYAADEYFQAKHDEDLMRWRDPLEPDRVVSRMIGGGIHVYDERALTYSIFTRPAFGGHAVRTSVGDFGFTATADRFFEAHPEPKPWEAAKRGDVWAITTPVFEEPVAATWTASRFAIPDGAFTEYVSVESVTSAELVWRAGAR